MAFNAYGAAQNEAKSDKPQVDFEALNKYVVETAQLQDRETLVGYISSIVDLGLQEQEDAEVPFTGTPEDEAKAIEEKPATYFKDGFDPQTKKPARMKCWPQRPTQAVAVAIEFPDILIDKGQFFGESKPLPLRIWMGGQFYIPNVGMVVQRPTPLKVNKSMGFWSFDKKHLFHKMAVASKLIKPDEAFLPQDIDKLLGKSFQFEAQVFFKESKGKEYYTEYIKFVGGLGRGQKEADIVVPPTMIQFNEKNDVTAIKELRSHIVNTIKKANNFTGSEIEKQLAEVRGVGNTTTAPSEEKKQDPVKPTTKPKAAKPAVVEQDEFDDQVPF